MKYQIGKLVQFYCYEVGCNICGTIVEHIEDNGDWYSIYHDTLGYLTVEERNICREVK